MALPIGFQAKEMEIVGADQLDRDQIHDPQNSL